MQIRADNAVIEQLIADQVAHAGSIEEFKATLQTHVSQALTTLDGGIGTEEHQACMTKANALIDGYCENVGQYQRGTEHAGETFLTGGRHAAQVLARGA